VPTVETWARRVINRLGASPRETRSMPISVQHDDKARGRKVVRLWSQQDVWIAALAALPVTVVALALVLPPVLILPAVAVLAIGAGFALEGARLLSKGRLGAMYLKEYAAGLVFAGLAATVLADPDGAMLALSEFAGGGAGKDGSDR
jgi:hypothetical protein